MSLDKNLAARSSSSTVAAATLFASLVCPSISNAQSPQPHEFRMGIINSPQNDPKYLNADIWPTELRVPIPQPYHPLNVEAPGYGAPVQSFSTTAATSQNHSNSRYYETEAMNQENRGFFRFVGDVVTGGLQLSDQILRAMNPWLTLAAGAIIGSLFSRWWSNTTIDQYRKENRRVNGVGAIVKTRID